MAAFRERFFPEQGNRQPVRGRVDLAVSAPPRPGSRPDGRVITPDRPVAPSIPRPDTTQRPAPEQGPARQKTHTGRNIALAGIGAFGVGLVAAYETIPAVHESVDSFLNSFTDTRLVPRAETNTVNPDEVFDSGATSGEIKPNDLTILSQQEIDKLDALAQIGDRNTVLVLYPIDVSTSNKPDAKIKFKKTYTGNGNEQDRIDRAEQGFFNVFDFDSVPAGSTIHAPIDGNLVVHTWSGNPTPINDHDFITATIDFLVNGEEYTLIISGGEKTRGPRVRGDVFRSLTNAPITGSNMSPGEKIEIKRQAIPIKRGDPILQVADKDVKVTFVMRGSIDMSKLDKWKFKEEVIDGKTVRIAMEDPTNLELFLSDGLIVQPPAPTKRN